MKILIIIAFLFSFNFLTSQQIKCEKNRYHYFGKFSQNSESYIMITDFVNVDNKYSSDLKAGYGFIKEIYSNGNKKIISFNLSCTSKSLTEEGYVLYDKNNNVIKTSDFYYTTDKFYPNTKAEKLYNWICSCLNYNK
jgi:hypothetical protein